jgi:TonB family protein
LGLVLSPKTLALAVIVATATMTACRESRGDASGPATPPIPMGDPPVEYPPSLFAQGIGGSVELLLFVDSTGQVQPESTRIQRSSGHIALDSAALAAAPRLRYSPATRNGRPVATSFLQPIHFRHPGRTDSVP